MSGWDFWNNPLVVTAMRLKYRKGSPGLTSSAYAVALLGIGGVLHYFELQPSGLPIPFGRAYLLAILALQFALSGGMALFGVSSSITAEVANRTLDFQRIVSLSPRQIMLGKMLGEPALGYFFALTTIPFAVICWFLGAAPGPVIVLLYVNLATFTVMAASCGLMHTLVVPENSPQKNKGSFAGLFIMAFFMLPSFLANSGAMLGNPWPAVVIGTLTPVASLVQLAQGNAWDAIVPLWGLEIPSLVAAPIVQLAIAAWIVAAMSRRLRNTLDPPLKRSRVYGATLAVDLVAAGVCYAEYLDGTPLAEGVYRFCLAHLVASLMMTLAGTPSRDAVSSWMWRRRGRVPAWPERLWGDRSPALAMYAVQALIGVVVFLIAAWLPASVNRGPLRPTDVAEILPPLLATGAFAVALATVFQTLVAVASKSGRGLAVFLIAMITILPPIIASVLDEMQGGRQDGGGATDVLLGISPAGYLLGNISRWDGPTISAAAPLVTSAVLFALAALALNSWIVANSRTIGGKLAAMGVNGAALGTQEVPA